ncbi:CheR family methyltransferase [Sagittula sp. S175]|uniref:CheR family methyltransferase n=1 Tax=Sagittula sp. S175 TaxID=3415129 RepID=UPI003C7A0821
MTTSDVSHTTKDIPFSDSDFRAIAELAQSAFGLNLAESKKPLVYSRLSKRLKARAISTFPEYLDLLNRQDERDERLELISALTTNVTSFFREKHHFETLRNDALPQMQANIGSGKRGRIWSAGCSSGQEAYSIAMTVLETIPDAGRKNIKILATDIDPKIVERAKLGEYPNEELTGIPEQMRKKWTESKSETNFSMSDAPRNLITFAELNLMTEWPFKGPFDVIFCRNVAIYFNQETQQRLWDRFREMLTPGGYLFIGHSERVTGPAAQSLNGIGITSYQKFESGGRLAS